MRKTGPMLTVEAVTGRDIRDLITDAVRRAGSIAEAAKEFNLSTGGMYGWLEELEGEIETRSLATVRFKDYVPSIPDDEPAAADDREEAGVA